MTNYIKNELTSIESAISLAIKYDQEKIKNILFEIKEIFKNDENKNEIDALYEQMPLIYTILFCKTRRKHKI